MITVSHSCNVFRCYQPCVPPVSLSSSFCDSDEPHPSRMALYCLFKKTGKLLSWVENTWRDVLQRHSQKVQPLHVPGTLSLLVNDEPIFGNICYSDDTFYKLKVLCNITYDDDDTNFHQGWDRFIWNWGTGTAQKLHRTISSPHGLKENIIK